MLILAIGVVGFTSCPFKKTYLSLSNVFPSALNTHRFGRLWSEEMMASCRERKQPIGSSAVCFGPQCIFSPSNLSNFGGWCSHRLSKCKRFWLFSFLHESGEQERFAAAALHCSCGDCEYSKTHKAGAAWINLEGSQCLACFEISCSTTANWVWFWNQTQLSKPACSGRQCQLRALKTINTAWAPTEPHHCSHTSAFPPKQLLCCHSQEQKEK